MADKTKTITIKINARTGKIESQLGGINDKLGGGQEGANSLGNAFGKSFVRIATGAIAGGAALAVFIKGVKASVKAAAEFETGIAEWATLSDVTPTQIDFIGDSVKELAADIGGGNLDEYSQGLYDIQSAGFSGSDALLLLRQSGKLAVGGVTDISKSADLLTTVLNAYGLQAKDAEHVSDVLFGTVKAGKTTIDQLGVALGRVAPLAATADISIEELGGAVAALTAKGVNTNEAVTQLRGVIAALAAPTDTAKAALEGLGIGYDETFLKTHGLQGAVSILSEKLGSNLQAWKAVIPEIEATAGSVALATADFADLTESVGLTEEAFLRLYETTGQTNQRLKNELQATMIDFGNEVLPAQNRALKTTTYILGQLRDLFTGGTKDISYYNHAIRDAEAEQRSLNEQLERSGGIRASQISKRLQELTGDIEGYSQKLADLRALRDSGTGGGGTGAGDGDGGDTKVLERSKATYEQLYKDAENYYKRLTTLEEGSFSDLDLEELQTVNSAHYNTLLDMSTGHYDAMWALREDDFASVVATEALKTEAVRNAEEGRAALMQAGLMMQGQNAKDALNLFRDYMLNALKMRLVDAVSGAVSKTLASVPWPLNIGLGAVAAIATATAFNAIASKLPSFRGGVDNFGGGLAQLHKDEIVSLPQGASVMSQIKSRETIRELQGKGGGTVVVHNHLHGDAAKFLDVVQKKSELNENLGTGASIMFRNQ